MITDHLEIRLNKRRKKKKNWMMIRMRMMMGRRKSCDP